MGTARNIATLTALNVLGALVGLGASLVTAYFFGTRRALEVYFAASTLEILVQKLTQTGQVAEVFLPIYHRIRQRAGQEAAQEAFAVLTNWVLLAVAGLAAGLWLAAPWLIRLLVPGFSAEDHALGTLMFRCLLPVLGLQVASELVHTLANAESWFGRPEAVAVGARSAMLLSMILLAGPLGTWSMVASTWVGLTLQAAGLLWMLKRMGYRHRFRLRSEHFRPAEVFGKLASTWGYVGCTQVYLFALNAGLSFLPQGTYAVFKYVQQIYDKTSGILLRPVSIVFFTHLSEAMARGAQNVRQLARAALARCLAIVALASVAVWAGGKPLLAALWGADRFGAAELDLAANLLGLFYILLLAVSLSLIVRKTMMSLGYVHRQYWVSATVVLMSALAGWLLIGRYGVAGVMLTVGLAEIGLGLAPLGVLLLVRREVAFFYPLGTVAKWLPACLAGLSAAYAAQWLAAGQQWGGGRIGSLLWACVLGGLGTGVAFAVAWLVGVPEVREVTRRIA